MLLAALLRGPGLAGVFLLGAVLYFLSYETLHALYHLPSATLDRILVGRLPLFRRMQSHHAHHHILRRIPVPGDEDHAGDQPVPMLLDELNEISLIHRAPAVLKL